MTHRLHRTDGAPKLADPNRTGDGRLACAYGEYWLGPHFLCAVATAAICGVPYTDVPVPDYSRYAPKLLGPVPIGRLF